MPSAAHLASKSSRTNGENGLDGQRGPGHGPSRHNSSCVARGNPQSPITGRATPLVNGIPGGSLTRPKERGTDVLVPELRNSVLSGIEPGLRKRCTRVNSSKSGNGAEDGDQWSDLTTDATTDAEINGKPGGSCPTSEDSVKVFGKTPDGTLFEVPDTKAVLGSVFGRLGIRSIVVALMNGLHLRKTPSTARSIGVNVFDLITVSLMSLQIFLFFADVLDRKAFLAIFVVWRLLYNLILGLVLKAQSESGWLLSTLRRIWKDEKWNWWFRRQYELKLGHSFDWDGTPDDFKAWLVFRNFVDLVLINDFATYLIFAVAYWEDRWTLWGWLADFIEAVRGTPVDSACQDNMLSLLRSSTTHASAAAFLSQALCWVKELSTLLWKLVVVRVAASTTIMDVARYAGAVVLFVFNVWVKMDAHRVVKDFAWYWGDFFFLLANPSLTFDGVFEMAPHPMYSVGYTWKYGISFIARSYTVLLTSVLAHALQMVFLVLVENPHIDKTYGAAETNPLEKDVVADPHLRKRYNAYFRPHKELKLFFHFDPFRFADLVIAVLVLYTSAIGVWGGVRLAMVQYVCWQTFHTFGLGCALKLQSSGQKWTRHFLRRGMTKADAFQSWKGIVNLSMSMVYMSFAVCAFHYYAHKPVLEWTGPDLLRHIVGASLVFFQVWQARSSYEVLGDFGWFYGDFFIEEFPTKVYYTGIFRYMNNPEKVFGHLAFWGMAVLANSLELGLVTLAAHVAQLLFLHYVEGPHMRKLYGDQMRKEGGIARTVKSRMIQPILEKVKLRRIRISQEVNLVKTKFYRSVDGASLIGIIRKRRFHRFADDGSHHSPRHGLRPGPRDGPRGGVSRESLSSRLE